MDYFDQQNIKFFDFLEETFNIKKAKRWSDITLQITELKMKRTYRVFADLFPRKIKYYEELEKSAGGFKNIHYAQLKGRNIINEVVRFSLYTDQVIVFHPLQNPAVTNERLNPGKNPYYWLPDFMEALYFYIVIQKWVRAGIVKLIINPYEYDLSVRERIDSQAKKRVEDLDFQKFVDIHEDSVFEGLAEQFALVYKYQDEEKLVAEIMKMNNPKFEKEQATRLAGKIIQIRSSINPLYESFKNWPQAMVTPTKSGGPVESIILLAETLKANIYTPDNFHWQQLQTMELNDFWLKANYLYSKIPLNFLNNVDTSFALEIRKEDRLSGVRVKLRKIFERLNSIKANELTETVLKDMFDDFHEEIKQAEQDWKNIKRDASLATATMITTNLGNVVTNTIDILPLAVGTGVLATINHIYKNKKIESSRIKNPVSVFVDLKNQPQGFFSHLKNCIL